MEEDLPNHNCSFPASTGQFFFLIDAIQITVPIKIR